MTLFLDWVVSWSASVGKFIVQVFWADFCRWMDKKLLQPSNIKIICTISETFFTTKYIKDCLSSMQKFLSPQTVQLSKCWMLIIFQFNSNITLLLNASYCVLFWCLVVQWFKNIQIATSQLMVRVNRRKTITHNNSITSRRQHKHKAFLNE